MLSSFAVILHSLIYTVYERRSIGVCEDNMENHAVDAQEDLPPLFQICYVCPSPVSICDLPAVSESFPFTKPWLLAGNRIIESAAVGCSGYLGWHVNFAGKCKLCEASSGARCWRYAHITGLCVSTMLLFQKVHEPASLKTS